MSAPPSPSVCPLFQVGDRAGKACGQDSAPYILPSPADAAHSADGGTARASVRRANLREEEATLSAVRVGSVGDPGSQR